MWYENWRPILQQASSRLIASDVRYQFAKFITRPRTRARSNGIDIEVSRHHMVSVSNFKSIEASTDDWLVHF